MPVFPGPSADANRIFASECLDTTLRAECINGGRVGLVCAQAPQVLTNPATMIAMLHWQENLYNQTIKPKVQWMSSRSMSLSPRKQRLANTEGSFNVRGTPQWRRRAPCSNPLHRVTNPSELRPQNLLGCKGLGTVPTSWMDRWIAIDRCVGPLPKRNNRTLIIWLVAGIRPVCQHSIVPSNHPMALCAGVVVVVVLEIYAPKTL